MKRDAWASDTPISEPVPPPSDRPVMAETGDGFGFTVRGIVHNITEEQVEFIFTPTYAPADFSREG